MNILKRFNVMFLVITLISVLVSGFFCTVSSFDKSSEIKSRLISDSEAIANFVSIDDLKELSGSSADLQKDEYVNLKSKLKKTRESDDSIRFVYLLGKDKRGVFFYVDSEDSQNSESYSPPGEIYSEASDDLISAFSSQESFAIGPYLDRYGRWVSGFAPIYNDDGVVVAVVGVDMLASQYYKEIVRNLILPISTLLVVLLLLFILFFMIRSEQRLIELQKEIVTVASHDLRSPLNGIRWGAEYLNSSKDLTVTQLKMVRAISESVNRLNSTIDSILQLVSLDNINNEVLQKSLLKVYDVISAEIKPYELIASSRNISFRNNLQPLSNVILNADREKLARVYRQIFNIALIYANDDSEIELNYTADQVMHRVAVVVHSANLENAESIKEFKFLSSNKKQKISIKDTGLGLYLALSAIKYHSGNISMDKTVDNKLIFYIDLPKE